jgi:hypothetical protein
LRGAFENDETEFAISGRPLNSAGKDAYFERELCGRNGAELLLGSVEIQLRHETLPRFSAGFEDETLNSIAPFDEFVLPRR